MASLKVLQGLLFCSALVACAPSKTTVQQLGSPPTSGLSACSGGPTSVGIKVFDINPFIGSGNPSLPFNANLLSSYTSDASISGLTGNCLLQNDHYQVVSDGTYSAIATASRSTENYTPSDPQFEQFNSFYYSSQLEALLKSLGANLNGLGTVSIDAHCAQQDNSFYSPTYAVLCFGYSVYSGKTVWAADDADVVVHETGHTVNHTLSSTQILSSSGEAGAIDEGLADYWAITKNDNPVLSEWFLGSMGAGYIRDASLSLHYPESMVYEIHEDSRVLSEALWTLRSSLGAPTTDALVKRTLQLLPATTRYKDFYQSLYTVSGPGFLNLSAANRSLIVSTFTDKGLHRADSATGLRLSTHSAQVTVIDDHTIDQQDSGNCNGQLDVGETALVLVNLENANAVPMGMGVATLGTLPAGITVPAGGNIGEFYKFNASSDFITSLPANRSYRADSTMMAAFLLTATSSGVKNLSLSFTPMFSDPTGGTTPNPDVVVNFSLTVGTSATSSACTNASLWP